LLRFRREVGACLNSSRSIAAVEEAVDDDADDDVDWGKARMEGDERQLEHERD
jgi:hypothetical protein